MELDQIIPMQANSVSLWGGEYGVLKEQLSDYTNGGYSVAIFAGTEKGGEDLGR